MNGGAGINLERSGVVLPGNLPLSIIRGIAFETRILQCKDENVLVSGTLNPNVAGVFNLTGQFGGYDLYVKTGAPSTFLYYNAAATSYVIARLLTTAALTDYWSPAAPLTEPTGTYAPHGAVSGTATATDNPVDLTGFTPTAEVRRTSTSNVTLDLNPSVTDPTNGEITIPGISSDDTQDFDFVGTFNWDLVLKDGGGNRVMVALKGPFVVTDNITHKTPT